MKCLCLSDGEIPVESPLDSEDEEGEDSRDLKNHNLGLSDDQFTDLHKYFQLLAALDYNHHIISQQQRLIDDMMDKCGDM